MMSLYRAFYLHRLGPTCLLSLSFSRARIVAKVPLSISLKRIKKKTVCKYFFKLFYKSFCNMQWQWDILCISVLPRRLWATRFLFVLLMKRKLQMKVSLIHLLCKIVQLWPLLLDLWRACVLILYYRIPINACTFLCFYHSCALRVRGTNEPSPAKMVISPYM